MKKSYKASTRTVMDWTEYLDVVFPRGLTIGKAYKVSLPNLPGRDDAWVRRQVNMAIHRRFPDLKGDGHKVHVRLDLTSSEGGTEIYVS